MTCPAFSARKSRGRAVRPGLGRTRLGAAAAAFLGLTLAVSACGGHSDPYGAKQFTGQPPPFLPKASLHPEVDRVLTGTATKPAVSIQGEPVEVSTKGWSVLVDVNGPIVPGEGLRYQTAYTTCTWTVTLSGATARIPVSLSDFNSIDHLGQIYKLGPVPGAPAPPTSVGPGQKVSFQVRAYEAIGEGLMRWAPDGTHIVAMWDYEVEND